VKNLLVVAIPVSKPKRNVPIAANSAMPKVYNSPIVCNSCQGSHDSFWKRMIEKKQKMG
jgi:hypothetical protein